MSEQNSAGHGTEATVEFGNYLIHELIGAGGMAEVYRATVREPDDRVPVGDVVIKRVKPQHAKDPGFVRMFVDEAKLSAQLQHPNIVSVFEFGESEGHHYIAMEYIDGLHLQGLHVRHAQRHKRALPWAVGLQIVRDLLRGLEYAHGKADEDGRPMGLVHRDINLVNIMVARSGAVKVLDFGIVKAADGIRSSETVGGVLKGKFGYMSPEQAEGKPLDPRSDVFSASIVLHELLTGRRLFWGKDDLEILRKVRDGDIPDPREFTPEVPADLVEVVLRGLARPLAERFQSAGEMADALDEIVRAHHLSEGALAELMEDLLGPERSEASGRMAHRRRKMTLLAWQQGVVEQEPPRPAKASGVISRANVEPTAPGRGLSKLEEGVEQDTLITTDIRYMTSVGEAGELEPVLSEQDVAVLEGLSIDELGALRTVILPEDEVGGAAALSGGETQILADEGPPVALSAGKTVLVDESPDAAAGEQKTVILDEEPGAADAAPDAAAGEQKTVILDEEPGAADAAPEAAPDAAAGEQKTVILDEEPGAAISGEVSDTALLARSKEPGPAPTSDAPEDAPAEASPARRRRVRILLAITAALAVVVVVLLILKNR